MAIKNNRTIENALISGISGSGGSYLAEYIINNHQDLEKQVYVVPEELDASIAELKLEALGVEIDELTEEQQTYLSSWTMGT